jgi:hypothetical protein
VPLLRPRNAQLAPLRGDPQDHVRDAGRPCHSRTRVRLHARGFGGHLMEPFHESDAEWPGFDDVEFSDDGIA